MQTLIALLKPFLSIVVQRQGPDILPQSRFLLTLVIAVHIAGYFLGMLALDASPGRAVATPLLDTVAQYAFFSVLVLGMGFRERLIQTLTAAFGADALLNLLLLPVAMMPRSDPPESMFPALASLVVLLWSFGVKGHILNRAIGLPYFVGVLIAAGFSIAFRLLDNAIYGAPI